MVFSSLYSSFNKHILIFNKDLNTASVKVIYNIIINNYLRFDTSILVNNNFDKLLNFLFILNYSVNYTFLKKKYKFIFLNLYFLDNILIFYFIKNTNNLSLGFNKLSFLFEHISVIYNLLYFDSKYFLYFY